jgi:hypothetical protein
MLNSKSPFTFVRFSDGEIEILRNRALFIGEGKIVWHKGSFHYDYPEFDSKDFNPDRDIQIRLDLINSAIYQSKNYFKGIPASHNSAILDRNLMIEFNNNTSTNLTFADLLINKNFLKFRREIVPIFMEFNDVYLVGNFRARPEVFNSSWKLVPIQDNFFSDYENIVNKTMKILSSLPLGSLVLGSASSLTNILGQKLNEERKDITFLDVGTSMHDLFELDSGIRDYHKLLLPNTFLGMYRKVCLISKKSYRLKW